jgi:hypothetical protein
LAPSLALPQLPAGAAQSQDAPDGPVITADLVIVRVERFAIEKNGAEYRWGSRQQRFDVIKAPKIGLR